jgi:GH24 family phage-related lysozyme (muramidase)
MTQSQIESIISNEATLRGIDPNVAITVFRNEGAGSYQSLVPRTGNGSYNGREASFGPYQLYIGGGLGNAYQSQTGRNLITDNTQDGITNQIRFALNNAVTSGWTPWYGAAAGGISARQGLNGAHTVNNVNNSPYTSETVPSDVPVNNIAGNGQPVVVVGDSIAVGTGPALANLREGVVTSATVSASSAAIASSAANNTSIQNAQWAVLSVGSNDDVTNNTGKGQLTSNLFSIRTSLNAQNYTWILPKDPIRREVVYGFARGKGDNVVDIGASTDGIHPKNYTEMANNVNATISTQTKAPDNAANTNSTAAVNNSSVGVQLASFSTDGDYTLLNVSFPPGNHSDASNASVITGTLQVPTNNTEQPTTNYNSTDGGMIMINAVKDMHLYANRDMYQTSDGRTARTAKGNLFDYSYGSYDIAVGGYLTLQSNGLLSLGTSNNLVLQGTRVDINGPAAAGALSAPSAKEPIDSFQQDNEVLAPGQFRFVVKNTILSALAYHEPYANRGVGQSAQGRVETGPVVDSNGQSIPSGASTSGADRPLDLLGSPNPNSKAGYYQGTGYDSKGQPQYTYVSPPNGEQVPAGQLSLSPAGVNFLVGEESSRSTLYDDVGNPAIGYGHNLLPDEIAGGYVNILGTKRSLSIGPLSADEINGLFRTDAAPREQQIRNWCKVPISQTQFDMLFSLVYNVGYPGNVFKKLNTGDYNVGTEWQSWHYATIKGVKQSLPGLVSRRAAEWQNFSGGKPINPSGSYS